MFTGFGIAILGVAVGTVAGISSISAAPSAKRGCTNNQCPPETYSDIDSAKTAGNISTAAFIVAAGGAALGIVGLLTTKSSDTKTESAGVRPWIGAGAAGVRGRF
jgi:hypothetical protein